ncbi:MAG: transglycosylase SLT domain-containing protein [Bacteroidota bacterium]
MHVFFEKYKKQLAIAAFALLLIVIIIISFRSNNGSSGIGDDVSDRIEANVLDEIRQRGKLIAITDFNSINYFIYRGKTMGFQYELLKKYASHLGVDLEIKVNNDLDAKFDSLKQGRCDIIGIDLAVTQERKKQVDFTVAHSLSRQVLVQRKPEGFRRMTYRAIEDSLIRSQLDLAEKTIYVQKNTSFVSRLKSLENEIGSDIDIVESDYESEQLVRMVASGEIDYTVCDEHVAMVNRTYYDNIDIQLPVSFPQKLAWAVPKGADSLRMSADQWLEDFKETAAYQMLYHKYFLSRKSVHKTNQKFHSLGGGHISPYDDLIKKYSKEIGWDWRLLAALIFQESRFNPSIESWAGAKGLMQLMPATGERFGADNLNDPEQNIRAGVRFLKYLEERFASHEASKEDCIRFVLASYNIGLGHVLDARRLAEKFEADTNSWEEVDTFLLYKSIPKYYNDPVVKHGYARGDETYKFVHEIMNRYDQYKTLIPE